MSRTANPTVIGRQRKVESIQEIKLRESIRHVLGDPKAHAFLAWLREGVMAAGQSTFSANPTELAYNAGRHDTLKAFDQHMRAVDAEAFGKHLAARLRELGEQQISTGGTEE